MARFAAIRGSVAALAFAAALAGCAKEAEPDDTLSASGASEVAGPPPPLSVDSAQAAPVAVPSGPAVVPAPAPTTVPASSNEAAQGATTSPVKPATPATPQTDSGHVSN